VPMHVFVLLDNGYYEKDRNRLAGKKLADFISKENGNYIFLKRFSKACRASVGREGIGGGALTVDGWE
jgi:hypothetical protein